MCHPTKLLSSNLVARYGKGFSERNIEQMRLFYLLWPIPQTVSAKSRTTLQKVAGESDNPPPHTTTADRPPAENCSLPAAL